MHLAQMQSNGEKEVKKTNVTFFFGTHTGYDIKVLKEYVKRNPLNILVLEWGPDDKFNQMLEGNITIDEYIKYKGPLVFQKVIEEDLKFFKELHKKGVRIETLISENERGLADDAVGPLQIRLSRCIKNGDFEGAVDASVGIDECIAMSVIARDKFKSKEIADRIRSGDWSGDILVYAGRVHSSPKNSLLEELKGMKNVSISSFHPFRELVGETFGKNVVEVYSPHAELTRAIIYETLRNTQPISEERKRLLGARTVIQVITGNPDFKSKGDVKSDYEDIKFISQLSYDKCKKIFSKIMEEFKDRHQENMG